MTPIELKALRESLHLSIAQASGIAGVSDRTLKAWESKIDAPADYQEAIAKIDDAITYRVESLVDQLTETDFFDSEDTYTLPTYADEESFKQMNDWDVLPFACTHRAWAIRAKKAIELMGGNAELIVLRHSE